MKKNADPVSVIFGLLFKAYGPQHWWPGDTPFEVIVGAILTQNTSWTNVEKAIDNLKSKDCLNSEKLQTIRQEDLAELIRPSGYFNIKAKRLKTFINFLFDRFKGDLDRMFALPIARLRHELLSVNGIGPETADSILLYAGGYPTFVVDAYTKRIFTRLGLLPTEHTYHQVQAFFHEHLDEDERLFNEYHALIVNHAKEYCRTKPLCDGCPLAAFPCPYLKGVSNE
ncbi:MAG: endonuclease III domain-containing protein [Proteobacteria bacterium]|nr:endonuclease III domain-containing protein [Pseudomonadota bacterium]